MFVPFFQVRFMLETMLALKNNDIRKIPGYDPEPVERLKKLQRTLVCDKAVCLNLYQAIFNFATRWPQCTIAT